MALRIETFNNNVGGSVLYKAFSHPLIADQARALLADLKNDGPVAVYDPTGIAAAFDVFFPLNGIEIAGYFVQRIEDLGVQFRNHAARAVTELAATKCRSVLIASFDSKPIEQARLVLQENIKRHSFETLKLPVELRTDKNRYLSPLNFATNFAFFRDDAGQHTRLVTANYWTRYGAKDVTLWCRLFDSKGDVLAVWSERPTDPEGSIVIDSQVVRQRFSLPEFTGQLFIHVVGVAGHDIVKYALDTYGDDADALSATHDANSWPSDVYAGLPAPSENEDVILWVQNSHPITIPPGEIGLNIPGHDDIRWLKQEITPFATHSISVSKLLPGVKWPKQFEVQAGKHFVRPRYEVVERGGRRHIAHVNVFRSDLKCDPKLPELSAHFGKGYILPAPILPTENYASIALPTPMSTAQDHLPIAALLFDPNGKNIAEHRFGNLQRDQSVALDVSMIARDHLKGGFGHFELVYDFASSSEADGWLHSLFRYVNLKSGRRAETSFGAHIFNDALTYHGEPQSYSGPPPGLSTRLFLRLAPHPLDTACHLIYPVSRIWHERSSTVLILTSGKGREIARKQVSIPMSGSLLWQAREMFDEAALREAEPNPYVIIRDETCRLFGYQGVFGPNGGFSFDHMFGF